MEGLASSPSAGRCGRQSRPGALGSPPSLGNRKSRLGWSDLRLLPTFRQTIRGCEAEWHSSLDPRVSRALPLAVKPSRLCHQTVERPLHCRVVQNPFPAAASAGSVEKSAACPNLRTFESRDCLGKQEKLISPPKNMCSPKTAKSTILGPRTLSCS